MPAVGLRKHDGQKASRMIPGLPVSVDNACASRNVSHYFLTHIHTDHLRGIKNGMGISRETANLAQVLNITMRQDGRMGLYFAPELPETFCWCDIFQYFRVTCRRNYFFISVAGQVSDMFVTGERSRTWRIIHPDNRWV